MELSDLEGLAEAKAKAKHFPVLVVEVLEEARAGPFLKLVAAVEVSVRHISYL